MRKIFLVLSLFVLPINALELERVILASNNDPKYIQFWPIVAPLWERMGLRPTLALIGDTEYPVDTSIGDVIRFDPLPGVPESLQAQVIRLFLPILFPEEGCIISDIDRIFCLHHGVERRLDRGHWNVDFSKLDISRYIDCHCPRPYSAYKESI